MLNDMQREFIVAADIIPNWRTMSKYEIAMNYVKYEKEENDKLRDAYFAAFCLRYWHEIYTLYKEAMFLVRKLNLTIEDIADWYIESILNVFKYRAFMNSDILVDKENGGADKFMNGYVYRTIDSTRERYFQYYNYEKRKILFNLDRLDNMVDDSGRPQEVADENTNVDVNRRVNSLITTLFYKHLYVEALVCYFIAYDDCFVSKKDENGVETFEFSEYKLLSKFYTSSSDYFISLIKEFAPNEPTDDVAMLPYYTNTWLKIKVRRALDNLKVLKEVKELCY